MIDVFATIEGFVVGAVVVAGIAFCDHQRMRARIAESLEDVALLRSALSGATLLNNTLMSHQMPQAGVAPPAVVAAASEQSAPAARAKERVLH
jgi:hypothetical protein